MQILRKNKTIARKDNQRSLKACEELKLCFSVWQRLLE
jgi:hypothetical protein